MPGWTSALVEMVVGEKRRVWVPEQLAYRGHPGSPAGMLVFDLLFDSSVEKGEPSTLDVGGVIAGWQEGLQLMVVGEKARFWIPEGLAYKGASGHPKGLLVFEIELLAIK